MATLPSGNRIVITAAECSVLVGRLQELERRYTVLTWYARSNKRDLRLRKLQTRIEREFPEETRELNRPEHHERWHAFHRGCLEAARYVLRHLPDRPQQNIERSPLKIIIASRTQAEQLLMSKGPGPAIQHIISIGAPRDPTPAGFEMCATGIRLEFFDDTGEAGPRPWHVNKVIDFARQVQHERGKLLVHCEAGISRSSAAALTVFATWLGTGKEQEAVDQTYAAQPDAWPNSQFVELADELLGRDGALIAAVDKVVATLDPHELLLRYARRIKRGE